MRETVPVAVRSGRNFFSVLKRFVNAPYFLAFARQCGLNGRQRFEKLLQTLTIRVHQSELALFSLQGLFEVLGQRLPTLLSKVNRLLYLADFAA